MADYHFPEDLLYTREDEWVRRDGDALVVGITDYAQQQLGDVVFVELPEAGSALTQGKEFGVIESVKAVADLYAPVTGEVAEANAELTDKPERVNEDCYGDGWMLRVTPADPGQCDALMDAAAYRQYVDERKE